MITLSRGILSPRIGGSFSATALPMFHARGGKSNNGNCISDGGCLFFLKQLGSVCGRWTMIPLEKS
ncbi:hypothetical protein CPAR01_13014 [Colletotrichum paranaense]|nr:uncharacterized protein CPAR01_13014 [Colletotrichum paranaense]KAK1526486.1 hypothetical protein CPAR01_13014 [Colletotrichum paranaense]